MTLLEGFKGLQLNEWHVLIHRIFNPPYGLRVSILRAELKGQLEEICAEIVQPQPLAVVGLDQISQIVFYLISEVKMHPKEAAIILPELQGRRQTNGNSLISSGRPLPELNVRLSDTLEVVYFSLSRDYCHGQCSRTRAVYM